jgi:hypothetical protein
MNSGHRHTTADERANVRRARITALVTLGAVLVFIALSIAIAPWIKALTPIQMVP